MAGRAALPPGAAKAVPQDEASPKSLWQTITDTTTEGYSTYVAPAFSWATDKGSELIWFGATVSIVFGLPVLLELQREAMFQMEKDQLQEQQEMMQKSVQEQLQKGMMGGLLGGGGSGEGDKAQQ